jgi:hypothetical protein
MNGLYPIIKRKRRPLVEIAVVNAATPAVMPPAEPEPEPKQPATPKMAKASRSERDAY